MKMAIKYEGGAEIKKPAKKSKQPPKTPKTAAAKSKTPGKSKRGGWRPGAGRKKGSENKATKKQKVNLSFIARQHTDTAILALVDICLNGESESARVSAANALLDRGYGKPMQSHEVHGKNGGPIQTVDLTNATPEQLDALESLFGDLADESGGDDEGDPGGEGETQG